jgi:hypothetical protein
MHLHAHIPQLMPKSSPERTQTSWRDSSTKKLMKAVFPYAMFMEFEKM